jgi:hypothetical protein
MPFGPRNVLIAYNDGDVASEEIATSYAYAKSIPLSNRMSVSTDTDVSFNTLNEYLTDLETPVRNRIIALRNAGMPIASVVLSFRIPPIVIDTTNKATSSLLSSCLLATRTSGTANPFYLDMDEEEIAAGESDILSVMHLDASTLAVASNRVNQMVSASATTNLDGYVYIDPNDRYILTSESRQWLDALQRSTQTCPFQTVIANTELSEASSAFSRIVDGSIVFSSGVEYAGTGYFKDTSRTKAFFFNADLNGFSNPRDASSQKPAIRAVEDGYAVVAGMTGNPSAIDDTLQYPDPRSIIYCASKGIPMGCALIWSQRAIGEHLAVYGDPLASFVQEAKGVNKFPAIDGFYSAMSYIAQARAQSRTREMYVSRILRIVTAGNNYQFKIKFLSEAKAISFSEDGISLGLLADPSSELRSLSKVAGYSVFEDNTVPSFEDIVKQSGKKIPLSFLRSNVDSNLMMSIIGASLVQPKGIAVIEFRLPTIGGTPRFFHMQVVATDAEGNKIFTIDSINRSDLWRYEAEPGIMREIPPEGIYTALAGRYVEFTHPEIVSPPLTRIYGQFSIITIGSIPSIIHETEWRTQE